MTAQDLDASIKEDIDGLKELVFDMSGQGSMKVIKPKEIIREIFEDIGFINILNIEK